MRAAILVAFGVMLCSQGCATALTVGELRRGWAWAGEDRLEATYVTGEGTKVTLPSQGRIERDSPEALPLLAEAGRERALRSDDSVLACFAQGVVVGLGVDERPFVAARRSGGWARCAVIDFEHEGRSPGRIAVFVAIAIPVLAAAIAFDTAVIVGVLCLLARAHVPPPAIVVTTSGSPAPAPAEPPPAPPEPPAASVEMRRQLRPREYLFPADCR